MSLTKKEIEQINSEVPYDQGIFLQPYGIPVKVKELVIYTRYDTGGYNGGSCWDNYKATPYIKEIPKDKFKVLDLVLKKIKPAITYLEFKEIESLIKKNTDSIDEYYGNSTDYCVEYIILSELYNFLDIPQQ